MHKVNLKALEFSELEEIIKSHLLPPYRLKQLVQWLYKKNITTLEEITEWPKTLREIFSQKYYIGCLRLIDRKKSVDFTEKFLFELEDGETVESVLIPDGDRLTLCISSQVGCPLGCKFCLTGKIGYRRNLATWEIIDQFLQVSKFLQKEGKVITNIVFMGMGEPLLNFENILNALWRFKNWINFSPRRITLSTAGIVPALRKLGTSAPSVKLAISLNAADDKKRSLIMPINNKYPLRELLKTLREYPLKYGQRITFEYVMLKGINTSKEDALKLAKILKGIPSKINLIPFNPWEGCDFQRPDEEEIIQFQNLLISQGYSVFIRKSKGKDILAACGQLRANYLNHTRKSKINK